MPSLGLERRYDSIVKILTLTARRQNVRGSARLIFGGRESSVVKKDTIHCALCKRRVAYADTGLAQLEEALRKAEGHCSYRGQGWTRNCECWVCPDCIFQGLAIPGDPFVQNIVGITGPFWAFWDVEHECDYCNVGFTFTAAEQKFWYETATLPLETVPLGCPDCRKIVRRRREAQKQLMESLPRLDPTNSVQLESIADNYLALEVHEEALQYLRRAKNRSEEPDRQRLLARIEDVKALPPSRKMKRISHHDHRWFSRGRRWF